MSKVKAAKLSKPCTAAARGSQPQIKRKTKTRYRPNRPAAVAAVPETRKLSEALRFALISEGSSDQALLPILAWVVRQHLPASTPVEQSWVDAARLPWRKVPTQGEGVDQLDLKAGQPVSVRVTGDTITIRRASVRKRWTEVELLKGVTPAMCGPDMVPDRAGRELI
jgi:antitoxin component of MazEF toxin-antitoxin module